MEYLPISRMASMMVVGRSSRRQTPLFPLEDYQYFSRNSTINSSTVLCSGSRFLYTRNYKLTNMITSRSIFLIHKHSSLHQLR